MSNEPLIISVRRGTIFQQKSWTHRADLVLGVDYMIPILPEDRTSKEMCLEPTRLFGEKLRMGLSFTSLCPPPCEDEMHLTNFHFTADHLLGSQALLWDHFQGILKWPQK